MDTCSQHNELQKDIKCLVRGQIQMQEEMSGISKTLTKLEDTNLNIIALRGEVATLSKTFERNEKDHDEMFTRIRAVEDASCHPRLTALEQDKGKCQAVQKVEARQEKMLWAGVATIALALITTLIKVVWK